MIYKIIDIQGIGPVYAEKLIGIGIETVDQLLEKGADPKGRQAIEDATGIRHDLVLTWVNHADLFRVKGVGPQFSELLRAARGRRCGHRQGAPQPQRRESRRQARRGQRREASLPSHSGREGSREVHRARQGARPGRDLLIVVHHNAKRRPFRGAAIFIGSSRRLSASARNGRRPCGSS